MTQTVTEAQTPNAQKIFWYTLAAIMALYMVNVSFVNYLGLVDKGPSWLGLDDSARATLNYAWIHKLNWGKDIVYTYGPFSFVSTRVGWGISRWTFLLFDVFWVFNFFFLFKDFLIRTQYKFLAFLVLFMTSSMLATFYGSGQVWVYYIFICYWMYKIYEQPRLIYFLPLMLLIIFSFYIKLNTGLFAIMFFIMHLVVMVLTRKLNIIKSLGALTGLILLLFIFAWGFNVSMGAYIKGAVEVMKGYNDIMYLEEVNEKLEMNIYLIFYSIWGFCVLFGLHALRTKQYPLLFFAMLTGLYIFLLKKQALLRSDDQHLYEFFFYAPLCLIIVCYLTADGRFQQFYLAFTLVTVTLCCAFANSNRPVTDAIYERYTTLPTYIEQFQQYKPGVYTAQKDKRYIPEAVLAKIGKSTIDVFPWDSEYLIQNGLNYTPRPCFQTFQANTEYLQKVNYEFFLNKSPQYVLYDYDAIDGCYPFNDAAQLNYFLIKNYDITDSFNSNERTRLILTKHPTVSPVTFTKIGEIEVGLNDTIPVKDADFMKLYVERGRRGKLLAAWDKPAAMKIMYEQQNEHWYKQKSSPEMLKAGLMVEKRIDNVHQFATFKISKDSLQDIINVKVQVDSPRFFKPKVKVEYYKVN